jgi:predicted lipoprotein
MVSRLAYALLPLLGLVLTTACGANQEAPPEADTGTYRHTVGVALLEHVVLPRLARLSELAGEFETEAIRQQAAESTNFAVLQSHWLANLELVQELEVLQIGPAANSAMRKGGDDQRDRLYSWPLTNSCRVDQVLVSGIYEQSDFAGRVMANVLGLDALEELLFREGDFHTCPPQLPIEAEGQWDALGESERNSRRLGYIAALTRGLRSDAENLQAAWAPSGGNFLGQAQNPGGDSLFSSPQCLLDELFAAMFHLDLVTKDKRIALPAGISPDCNLASCPHLLEFKNAPVSGLAVQANLRGVAALFSGDGGDGFDALLRHEGSPELAGAIETALKDAQDAARSLEVDWALLLESDPDALNELHAKVKVVTDLLKTQFASVLNLSVPQEGAADND